MYYGPGRPGLYHWGMLTRRTALIAATLAPWPARSATLGFGGLYGSTTADGVQLTPGARALVGQRVTIPGFMAPALKPDADFFVLTRTPMSTCPFCTSGSDWPVDIVFVRLAHASDAIEPSYAITATGTLEWGARVDEETGFVSLVRLTDAVWNRVVS